MRVIVAKNAGFCFGVRRAVELARKEARERGRVYTWGKLIHNEAVIRDLAAEGILPVETLDGLEAGDTLIIRAHGAPPALFGLREAGHPHRGRHLSLRGPHPSHRRGCGQRGHPRIYCRQADPSRGHRHRRLGPG